MEIDVKREDKGGAVLTTATPRKAERVSDSSPAAGWVSVSDLERFIYETRDDSNEFECEGDEAVAFGINQAMDGLTRLVDSNKHNATKQASERSE